MTTEYDKTSQYTGAAVDDGDYSAVSTTGIQIIKDLSYSLSIWICYIFKDFFL